MAFDTPTTLNYYFMQNVYLAPCYKKTQFFRVFSSPSVAEHHCKMFSVLGRTVTLSCNVQLRRRPLQPISMAILVPVPSNHCWVTCCTPKDELSIAACLLMSGSVMGLDVRLLCLRSVCKKGLFFLPCTQRKGGEKKTPKLLWMIQTQTFP